MLSRPSAAQRGRIQDDVAAKELVLSLDAQIRLGRRT
jgi:hypothetical protein